MISREDENWLLDEILFLRRVAWCVNAFPVGSFLLNVVKEKTKRHVASLPPLFSALEPHLTNLPVKPLSSLFLFLFFLCFYSTGLREFISSLWDFPFQRFLESAFWMPL